MRVGSEIKYFQEKYSMEEESFDPGLHLFANRIQTPVLEVSDLFYYTYRLIILS